MFAFKKGFVIVFPCFRKLGGPTIDLFLVQFQSLGGPGAPWTPSRVR